MPQTRNIWRAGTMTRLLASLICCTALSACGSMNSMLGGSSEEDALKDMKWTYADDGLQIDLQADPTLNQFAGQPHMLTLVIVQMETPNAFTEQTANADKLKTLLLAHSPPQGMLSLDRVFVAPGEQRKLQLARVEKTQYVGLVAGYNHLDPARSTRLYRVGVEVNSSGMIIKKREAGPEPLHIDLRLGPDSIQRAAGSKAEPVAPVKPQGGLVESPSSNSESGQP
ncbi:MAG: type VI secretion system lipoprotein TssJ [Alcaligenaceae bacterium]|nr:type VI secretion system lipoprotein TssJ [Alcaligenaceae bacterium]